MKTEIQKTELAGALIALGKMISRTAVADVCKSVMLLAENGLLKVFTTNINEQMMFQTPYPSEDSFRVILGFDEFRDAVRNVRGKTIVMEALENGFVVDDRILAYKNDVVWPQFPKNKLVCSGVLPEKFVSGFAAATQIVDRNGYRKILQGIHICGDGIISTNGKELLHIPAVTNLDENKITIPVPLALMQTKSEESGTLEIFTENENQYAVIRTAKWEWTTKALEGIYPNWKSISENMGKISHTMTISPETVSAMKTFLESISDSSENNGITPIQICCSEDFRIKLAHGKNMATFTGSFTGDWNEFHVLVNKPILLHLLQNESLFFKFSDAVSPFSASGKLCEEYAMPLRDYPITVQTENQQNPAEPESQSSQPTTENSNFQTQPQEEIKTMETVNSTNVVPVPVPQAVANEQEPTPQLSPLDELGSTIEAFRMKLKTIFDEAASLSHKVKEVQLSQKQKEREFILARKAIERLKLVNF